MNLLRPNQIAELERERDSLKSKLDLPPMFQVDKPAVMGQLKRVETQLSRQSPSPIPAKERDATVKRQEVLLSKILEGMPSHEEMRKNPPGAVTKHRRWEARNKSNVVEWKNNQLRLHTGTDDCDVANLEMYRPTKSTLNMDNAQIAGKDYYLPPGPIAIHNVMSDADREDAANVRRQLVKQALETKDVALAKFLGVDLGALGVDEPKGK